MLRLKDGLSALQFFLLAIILTFVLANNASAEDVKINGKPGERLVLETAACIELITIIPELERAEVPGKGFYAVYNVPDTVQIDKVVELKSSQTKSTDKCDGSIKRFIINTDQTPKVNDVTLGKAFNLLLGALVIALLLESAFALLFNWRAFLEFFVGKAWRTPILFFGSLLVVRQFDLDLMKSLFNAYHPDARSAPENSWFTSILTAMILAGGSVGVNRILIALGFRSQIRPDLAPPVLSDKEAWIAISVISQQGRTVNARIDVEELETVASGGAVVPATVGQLSPKGLAHRIKNLFFPSLSRFPRSGGCKVSTEVYYRIVVTDLTNRAMYDLNGKKIGRFSDGDVFRFAPRAIVDFEVVLANA